jgi:hypothetical protein
MARTQQRITEWLQNDQCFGLNIEDDPELTILPTLPSLLSSRLVIRNCPNLIHIPHLPDTLKSLLISDCPNLQILPTHMPSDLYYVDFESIGIRDVPHFSASLQHLMIRHAPNLKHISYLPPSLYYFLVYDTQLETLPTIFPPNLYTIRIKESCLRELPPLPDSLHTLECSSTQLTRIESFPKTLLSITIVSSPLTELPLLPPLLNELNIGDTRITRLPALPSTLCNLYIDSTPISELSDLPPNINVVSYAFTTIRTIPRLPTSLDVFNMSYTPNNYLRAADFAICTIYSMKTHALSIDEFPVNIHHIHFTNPAFCILELPPLRTTSVSFLYDGKFTTIRPLESLQEYESICTKEREKQKARVIERTRLYKEELMVRTWHPSRILIWCGVDFDSDSD